MTDIQTARHLAAITREAAARAYEADAGTSGKIAVWFMTVLTTLHAGGLVAALQYSEKLAMPYATQWSLLSGLIATMVSAVFALVHYNSLADRWRQEMHYEIEGAKEISDAAAASSDVAVKADWIASGLSVVSIGALALAGIFAITNLNRFGDEMDKLLAVTGIAFAYAGFMVIFRYGMPFRVDMGGHNLLSAGIDLNEAEQDARFRKLGWFGFALVTIGTVMQIVSLLV